MRFSSVAWEDNSWKEVYYAENVLYCEQESRIEDEVMKGFQFLLHAKQDKHVSCFHCISRFKSGYKVLDFRPLPKEYD